MSIQSFEHYQKQREEMTSSQNISRRLPLFPPCFTQVVFSSFVSILPTDLLTYLLHEWMEVKNYKSIGALDMAICNVQDRPRYLSALRGRKVEYDFPKLTSVTSTVGKFEAFKEWVEARKVTVTRLNITESRKHKTTVIDIENPVFHNVRHLTLNSDTMLLNMHDMMEGLLLLETLEITNGIIMFHEEKMNPQIVPVQHLTKVSFDLSDAEFTTFPSLMAYWGIHAKRLHTMSMIVAPTDARDLLAIVQHLPLIHLPSWKLRVCLLKLFMVTF
jgi:hypothetical protein